MAKWKDIEFKTIPNFKGGEGQLEAYMLTDELNKILKAKLAPGSTIGHHRHDTSSEIIFVISGSAKEYIDGKESRLEAGDLHYCKKGSTHEIINDTAEDFVFYAVVPEQ